MLTRLRDRFGTKVIAVAAVVLLVVAGVAAAATDILPEPAQEALAGAADRIADIYGGSDDTEAGRTSELTDAEGDIRHPMDNGKGVPQAVKNHFAELRVWIACIQDGAREHAAQQSDPDTREEGDEYSREAKEARCGPKPTNRNDDAEDEEIKGEGRPDHAGPPPWAGGPPPWAGGAPPWAGRPDDAGPPSGAGRP